MATLLEQLQQRLAGQQAAPTVEGQPNIAEILRAKKGKAITAPTGIANTSVAAGMVGDQAKVALQQQQQTGVMQAQNLAGAAEQVAQEGALGQQKLASAETIGAAQQAGQASRQLAETAANEQLQVQKIEADKARQLQEFNNKSILFAQKMASDRGLALDNIFSDVKQENAVLSARKDATQLEQKAAVLAWSDQAYMNELRRIGQQRNLTDEIAFNQATKELTFGKDYSAKLDELNFQVGQSADRRALAEQIAQLSNYEVIDLANTAIKGEMLKAQYEAGGTIAAEGAKYAAPKVKSYLNPEDKGVKNG